MMRFISSVTAALSVLLWAGMAFAEKAAAAAVNAPDWSVISGSAAFIGAGFAIGLAALGCGIGQGRGTAAALEGIARNPGAAGKIQGPFILGLALIESLAIYAFVVALILCFK